MSKGDTARARQLLLDDLENLRSIKGWRIEVVFDGAGRRSKSGPLGDTRQRLSAADRATSKEVSKHGVRTVFTGSGVEADSYIESRCSEAKNVTDGTMTGSFIVATDDAMIRLAGLNAGALCMGADRFVSELKAVKKSVAFRVEAAMAKVNGGTIRAEKLWGTQVFANNNARRIPAVVQGKDNISDTNSTAKPKLDLPSLNVMDRVQETEDGRTIYTGRFGRGALIIEDRRKKKPRKNGEES
jgi:predicted RNA-binding protein with PIN domain